MPNLLHQNEMRLNFQPSSISTSTLTADLRRRSKSSLITQLVLSLVLLDALVLCVSFLIGNLVLGSGIHAMTPRLLAVVIPVFFVAALNNGAYGRETFVRGLLSVKRALAALAITVAAVMLMAFFLKASAEFSRVVFGCGVAAALVLLTAGRLTFTRIVSGKVAPLLNSDVVICDDCWVVGTENCLLIDAKREGLEPRLDDPEMLDRIGTLLRDVDRIVVACPAERRPAWALALKGAGVEVDLLAPELAGLGVLSTSDYRGETTLRVARGPLSLSKRIMKRSLDLAIVLLSAPFWVPILVLVAIAIKLDSPGPVFFIQKRIGMGNRQFSMFKFRSMKVERSDASGSRLTGRVDDRVTRVGRVIRSLSLDELPQLINVLAGDMSVVGPRPHALGALAGSDLYWEVDHRYWHRHAIKPGMTGLAQVRGHRGTTFHATDLKNRLQADLEYAEKWSVWRDVAIILMTFRVLRHSNAF